MTIEKDPHGMNQHDQGAKLDLGKLSASLLGNFANALEEVARVATYGAKKYTREGWQYVPNAKERYEDAKFRHLLKYHQGEVVDADSSCFHRACEIWNSLVVLELILRDIKDDEEIAKEEAMINEITNEWKVRRDWLI